MTNPIHSTSDLSTAPAWRKMLDFYRWLKPSIWAMRLPWIGPRLQRAWIREGRDANWILPTPTAVRVPVGEAAPKGERCALPGVAARRLLDEAAGIFAMHACPCRTAFACKNHPIDLGCLFLGAAALDIPPAVGRVLTRAEAEQHLLRAEESGLIPTILYIPSEAEIFEVERTRLLALCLCCECCCDVRLLLRSGVTRYWDLYNHRLPGLRLSVSAACTRCGACVEACYGGERVIRVGTERAEIGERCIGCGRCIHACPQGAIQAELEEGMDWMDELLGRIRARVDIGEAERGAL